MHLTGSTTTHAWQPTCGDDHTLRTCCCSSRLACDVGDAVGLCRPDADARATPNAGDTRPDDAAAATALPRLAVRSRSPPCCGCWCWLALVGLAAAFAGLVAACPALVGLVAELADRS